MEAGSAVDIFRLPGIYGPGRSAIDQVKAGTARRIDKPGQVFSRIHVADVAGTVLLALAMRAPAPSTMSPTTCRPPLARSWPSPASF
jgi:nucleoside-diphosphate-sugar epimerase